MADFLSFQTLFDNRRFENQTFPFIYQMNNYNNIYRKYL